MNESARVKTGKEIIDKIIQNYPLVVTIMPSITRLKTLIVRRGKKQSTETNDYSVMHFVSQEGTRSTWINQNRQNYLKTDQGRENCVLCS